MIDDDVVITAKFKESEPATWIPMQAEIYDGTKIDFYPAFNEGDANVAKYKFAVKDGSTFNEITSVSSMSNIYNALRPASGTQTTTLYYQKIDPTADPLKCYTVKNLTWNYVFGEETAMDGDVATEYSDEFMAQYQKDGNGNDNGIKTPLLDDGFGSN